MSDLKYFNFPVQLLNGMFDNKDTILHDILCYSLFAHTAKLMLGNDIQKFKAAAAYYGVDLKDSAENYFERGEELYYSVPERSPKTGISTPMYWEFVKDTQSQFDIACLTAFLALRSIIGADSFCKTNNALMWARMDGNSKAVPNCELSYSVQKYCNEYQSVKIKNELRLNWGLVHYSRYTKGFYVSFKMDLATLATTAEKARKPSKLKEMQQRDRDTVEQVLKRTKSG